MPASLGAEVTISPEQLRELLEWLRGPQTPGIRYSLCLSDENITDRKLWVRWNKIGGALSFQIQE